ncbi:putative fructokinase [Arachis hypogaea]|nr:putative fructokinase [Arachis hypogaea]
MRKEDKVYNRLYLIDFVLTVGRVSLAEAPAFKKAPGGAPANIAVDISRLGSSSAFIGKHLLPSPFESEWDSLQHLFIINVERDIANAIWLFINILDYSIFKC